MAGEGYHEVICNCENSHCKAGHYVPPFDSWDEDDKFERCGNPAVIACDFIGQICAECAMFMPQQYLGVLL